MTTNGDNGTRIVLSWLRQDEHENAERVLLRALDEVDTTPQRRSWWPARRFALMNAYAKLAAAAAAVLVVVVVGYQFLPSNANPGTSPAPPSPTPTLSSSPTPIPALQSGTLQPGRYAVAWNFLRISFEVPTGWTGTLPGVGKNADQDTEIGWGPWSPNYLPAVTLVYTDACHSEGKLAPVGPSVDALVQALDSQANTDAVVTDVTIGGLPAKRVDIVQSPGLDRATCRGGADGQIQIWADAGEIDFNSIGPGMRSVVQIVDVGGVRVIFAGTIGAAASASDLAELDAIIASVEFGP